MSDGISTSFVDFAVFLFAFDGIRCASFAPFLVRNWWGQWPSVKAVGGRSVAEGANCERQVQQRLMGAG
jgi:hypothetical protein